MTLSPLKNIPLTPLDTMYEKKVTLRAFSMFSLSLTLQGVSCHHTHTHTPHPHTHPTTHTPAPQAPQPHPPPHTHILTYHTTHQLLQRSLRLLRRFSVYLFLSVCLSLSLCFCFVFCLFVCFVLLFVSDFWFCFV